MTFLSKEHELTYRKKDIHIEGQARGQIHRISYYLRARL